MTLRRKFIYGVLILFILVLGLMVGYGFYTGKFSASADMAKIINDIEANSKGLKNCSNGVCVSVSDDLNQVKPGDTINYRIKITVPKDKQFSISPQNCPKNITVCQTGFLLSRAYTFLNSKTFTYGDSFVFPGGDTVFYVSYKVPDNLTPGNDTYSYIYLAGYLVDESGSGYGYGYNGNNNFIQLYSSDTNKVVSNNPKLLYTSPKDKETNIALTTKVKAVFDSKTTGNTIKLYKGNESISGTTSYENDYKTVVFSPKTSLLPNIQYQAVVGGTSEIKSWVFTTKNVISPNINLSTPTDGAISFLRNISVIGNITDPDSPVSKTSLTINGIPVAVDQSGNFRYSLNLKCGVNLIVLTAKDVDGASYTKAISVRYMTWYRICFN